MIKCPECNSIKPNLVVTETVSYSQMYDSMGGTITPLSLKVQFGETYKSYVLKCRDCRHEWNANNLIKN